MSPSSRSGAPAPSRTPALRRRGVLVLATVTSALAAFGSTTQAWLSVTLPQSAVQTPSIEVPGSDAATAVTAFALVGLAAALAASIAGRIARWIIAVILTVAGVGIALSSLAVATDPMTAAEPAIGEALGVTSQDGASVTATAMPWLAAVAGLMLLLCAVWLLIAGSGWRTARRYENRQEPSPSRNAPAKADTNADEIDNWDSLSRGEDPTG
ncbi:Trp biosynthesis-associated membrane protein [Arthrobacter tumbae]|uniref:Trp biosynthesis-associated membrane protein n=1 Tax=Arthrobacter tumbae TaxID=163874 RepID=UPI00195A0ADB|nr:Trp biosynthesis-associated membrane protein [Arthrobacter tumbae]MBM7783022.1 putative membrane protein (TIGR02234 family) [Arthrobacter tumbae]